MCIDLYCHPGLLNATHVVLEFSLEKQPQESYRIAHLQFIFCDYGIVSQPLRDLLFGGDQRSLHFRETIPRYHSSFAFAFLGILLVDLKTFQPAGERLGRVPGLNLSIRISGDLRVGRQYASPSSDEVSVLIVDNPREEATTRDVVLIPRDAPITRINETNGLYDPLHYVLMFPYAETG
ncbi:hypothetical protein BDC45DRAFT_535173 [Circinella umbellata]|nr:hypothetical protein BDC45DRAFT_535173 [Circinella umbellata]